MEEILSGKMKKISGASQSEQLIITVMVKESRLAKLSELSEVKVLNSNHL